MKTKTDRTGHFVSLAFPAVEITGSYIFAGRSEASNLDNGSLSYRLYVYPIYNKMCATSVTRNAMKLVSHPRALTGGTAVVVWKTKVPVILSKFFPSFIGNSIVSTPCTLAVGDADNIGHKSILFSETARSIFLEDETSQLFHD